MATATTTLPIISGGAFLIEERTPDEIFTVEDLSEEHVAIGRTVDEFGGTAGLLTLEDVLSELLGHVGDEFKAAAPAAEKLPDGQTRLPGNMTVEDASTVLETKWDTDAATVSGLVIEALGHLPAPGEVVTIGHLEFEIERVAERVIESVIVRQIAPAPREGDS